MEAAETGTCVTVGGDGERQIVVGAGTTEVGATVSMAAEAAEITVNESESESSVAAGRASGGYSARDLTAAAWVAEMLLAMTGGTFCFKSGVIGGVKVVKSD